MDIKQSESILQIINKKQFLVEEKSDDIMNVLTSEEGQRIINGTGEFRNRIYTPLKTIYTFIKQVLSSDKSCNNAVSGVNSEHLVNSKESVGTNTGTYVKARNRLPEKTIHELAKSVGNSTKKNVDVIFPGHSQRRYDFRQGKRLGKKDHITLWKKPRKPDWMSKETYKEYPNKIQIREFKVNGVVYVTTFFDASTHPKTALHALYKRRWEVEIHLNSIKTIMGMNSVSCKTPEMVRKEIGVHFLAYNIIRELIVAACIEGEALPWQISFKATLQLLNQFTPRLLSLDKKKRADLYIQMLKLIVKNKVGNRPGRVEPRAIRQKRGSYPVLKNTRKVEQKKLLKQRKKRMAENEAA